MVGEVGVGGVPSTDQVQVAIGLVVKSVGRLGVSRKMDPRKVRAFGRITCGVAIGGSAKQRWVREKVQEWLLRRNPVEMNQSRATAIRVHVKYLMQRWKSSTRKTFLSCSVPHGMALVHYTQQKMKAGNRHSHDATAAIAVRCLRPLCFTPFPPERAAEAKNGKQKKKKGYIGDNTFRLNKWCEPNP